MTTLSEAFPQVGFGTSGVRALVTELRAPVVASFVQAFARHVQPLCGARPAAVVGWDLRPSSPGIALMVVQALEQEGWRVEVAGQVPTPALALRSMSLGTAGIMITGSHIPFDRNGIKFYSPSGEILKADEQAILSSSISDSPPSAGEGVLPEIDPSAREQYLARYRFPSPLLKGLRIGVYQHSAVGRDLLLQALEALGADVVAVGRSDTFVPIDTEAVSPDDEARAAVWAHEHDLDAVVSTDGDGDRPWVCDASGRFVRGDLLGLITARWLGVEGVVTPVSSNTAIERSGAFDTVLRTRIGSPYVIEGMQRLAQQGCGSVAGFEANGGFLLQHAVEVMDLPLRPLPTRDSLLPIVALLASVAEQGCAIDELLAELPARATAADRLTNVDLVRSRNLLTQLVLKPDECQALITRVVGVGLMRGVDCTDGLRISTDADEIIHLRPSGNAPELRVYTEAATADRARELCSNTMARLPALLEPAA